jgi:hypothetical protein
LTVVNTRNCSVDSLSFDQVFNQNPTACDPCTISVESTFLRQLNYTFTVYDPDNCCRFCIQPLQRFEDDEPNAGELIDTLYWGPTNTSLTCGVWPCDEDDFGNPCITDSENGPDCATLCAGTDCGGVGG